MYDIKIYENIKSKRKSIKFIDSYRKRVYMFGYVDMDEVFQIKTLYTAFAQTIGSGYFFAGERHNFWELVVAAKGQVGVTVGDDVLILQQGQAILHPPMEFHRIWYTGELDGEIIVLTFGACNVPQMNARLFALSDMAAVRDLLDRMRTVFQTDGINIIGLQGPPAAGQIALKQLELFLLEIMSQKSRMAQPVQSRPARNYARIIRLLENSIDKNWTVEDIARQCNMSQINVKQTFSKYAGMGIKQYFNRLKIGAAIPMLRDGSTVQEVSDPLGFSSQNYFCMVFKRITGRTPTSYRP